MKRVLINSNSMAASTAISNAQNAAATINRQLIPALKTIGIPINQDVMNDCFAGTGKTEKSYFDALEKDLKNIKTPAVSNSMEATATEAWEKFESALTEVRREIGNHHQHLTIVEGEAVLSLGGEISIMETNCKYLVDAKEIATYQLFIDIADKLNLLFKHRTFLYWNALFPADAAGVIHVAEDVDYSQFI